MCIAYVHKILDNPLHHGHAVSIGEVTISPSATITGSTEDDITLTCSANITSDPPPGESDVIFEWFFGQDFSSLPSGVMVSSVTKSGSTYSRSLDFFPLSLSHSGMYTCRLWNYSTQAASANITVFSKHPTVTLLAYAL